MRIPIALFIAFVAACTGCQTSHAPRQIPDSQPIGLHDERTERIGQIIKQTMRKENIPGISVAVIDHGKIVWAQGFGWRDLNRRLPVDTDTQFEAGSISKPVTALGVLRLKESGRLNLDADVNTYLKGWQLRSKFTNDPVTLRLLLCHRAGMVPHGFVGYNERWPSPSLLDVLNKNNVLAGWLSGNYFGPIKVAARPGSVYRYSGGGYCVVQKAVEDVTGEPFETAMARLVLQPLEMNHSNFQQPPQDTNDIACGYSWMKTALGGGRWRVNPEKAMGGLWTTPQDLARLIVAVQQANAGNTDGVLSTALVHEYLKPQFDSWQGIGIRLDQQGDYHGFYHAGENPGYFARFGAGVSDGRGWVIMSNSQHSKFGAILNAISTEFGRN